jgi:hypothetical protein
LHVDALRGDPKDSHLLRRQRLALLPAQGNGFLAQDGLAAEAEQACQKQKKKLSGSETTP